MNTSLANGAPLTPATWADFVTRLRHDCEGEGVRDHCTANALFIVEARRIVTGFDPEYASNTLVYCDDSSWYSPQQYWDDHDAAVHDKLDVLSHENAGTELLGFMELPESDQWDILDNLPDHHVTGWVDRWEYVNCHFTKDAAEAFIQRKKHDYPDGIRVYVESQHYAWEFNAIKDAILSGKLIYQDGVAS